MIKILILLFITISCSNQNLGEKFSYSDPFYLNKDQILVTCGSHTNNFNAELDIVLNGLLDEYQTGKKFNYGALKGNEAEVAQVCDALNVVSQTDLTSLSKQERGAFLINTYHLLIIHLVTKHYDEVQFPGKPKLPDFRSILNIQGLGQRVWTDLKWHVAGAYRSLAEIEHDLLFPLLGPDVHLVLQRGINGFQKNYKTVFTEENIQERLNEAAIDFVNRVTFFDDGEAEDFVMITSEFIQILESNFGGIRGYLAKHLDKDIVGIEIDSDDLFKKIPDPLDLGVERFLWKLESEPINWSINEVNL